MFCKHFPVLLILMFFHGRVFHAVAVLTIAFRVDRILMISQRNLKVEGRAIKINFICYYNLGGKAMNLLFPFMVFWFLCGSVMAETM